MAHLCKKSSSGWLEKNTSAPRLAISGAGIGESIIDANRLDQAFQVQCWNVEFSDLTIVQAQIINLLEKLKQASGRTYLFISHDLNIVQHISDHIGVMYLGKLVEVGLAQDVFETHCIRIHRRCLHLFLCQL